MSSFFERSPFVPRFVATPFLLGLFLLFLNVLLPRQLALVSTFGGEDETGSEG